MAVDGMATEDGPGDQAERDFVAGLAAHMVAKQCEWLNLWTQTEEWVRMDGTKELGYFYRPSDFSVTNTYGLREVLGMIRLEDHEQIVLMVLIHDGDEGGPQILTGFFDAETTSWYRHAVTGEIRPYDEVWRAGDEAKVWAKKVQNWKFFETRVDRWVLNDMVQEFDTMRTQVLKEGRLVNTPYDSRFGYGTNALTCDHVKWADGPHCATMTCLNYAGKHDAP
jgi:hypothetical protein